MKKVISKIEKLEAKQFNGTITFEEEARYFTLIELAEKFLNS